LATTSTPPLAPLGNPICSASSATTDGETNCRFDLALARAGAAIVLWLIASR